MQYNTPCGRRLVMGETHFGGAWMAVAVTGRGSSDRAEMPRSQRDYG